MALVDESRWYIGFYALSACHRLGTFNRWQQELWISSLSNIGEHIVHSGDDPDYFAVGTVPVTVDD